MKVSSLLSSVPIHQTIKILSLRNLEMAVLLEFMIVTLRPHYLRLLIEKNVWFIDVNTKTYMYETLGLSASSDKLLSWGPCL